MCIRDRDRATITQGRTIIEQECKVLSCLILKKLTCSTSKLMSVATKSSGLSRHTIEEKIEAVRQRIFQESSFRELQERHGICSATLSVWIKKYKAEVLRRFPVKDLPLYVLKYQETMTTEEENELTRLRRENEDLKLPVSYTHLPGRTPAGYNDTRMQ